MVEDLATPDMAALKEAKKALKKEKRNSKRAQSQRKEADAAIKYARIVANNNVASNVWSLP